MAGSSSLSSVVSSLVRASMGSSVPANVPDADLDRHVTDLILNEAKQQEEKYLGKDGIRAYRPDTGLSESSLPKTNKRFLTSIIKNVDDHNASVIQNQAKAAATAKEQQEEQERQLRRARANEAAGDRMRRLMGGSLRRDEKGRDGRSRDYTRRGVEGQSSTHSRRSRSPRPRETIVYPTDEEARRPKGKGKERRVAPSEDEERILSSDGHDGRRGSQRRRRSRSYESNDDSVGRQEASTRPRDGERPFHSSRRRSRSRESNGRQRKGKDKAPTSPSRTPRNDAGRRSQRSPSPSSSTRKVHRHRSHRSRSPSHKSSRATHLSSESPRPPALSRSPSPPSEPGPSKHIPSKMDKYFEPGYDPLLDVGPGAPSLNELVPEGAFDHWNAMLELVKLRQEDKAERKRQEKEAERGKRKSKDSSSKRKRKDRDGEDEDERKRRIRLGIEKPTVMDMQYAKRGAIREWDVGKEVI
ncbi:hypothetical protein FRB99_005036 [Tulasnella sp. 403]|nr:hypothetical protein FRB99_005036 [Tulasnella sp. 403]